MTFGGVGSNISKAPFFSKGGVSINEGRTGGVLLGSTSDGVRNSKSRETTVADSWDFVTILRGVNSVPERQGKTGDSLKSYFERQAFAICNSDLFK